MRTTQGLENWAQCMVGVLSIFRCATENQPICPVGLLHTRVTQEIFLFLFIEQIFEVHPEGRRPGMLALPNLLTVVCEN